MDDSAEVTGSTAEGSGTRPGLRILPTGTLVVRYVLLADIGVGGMGVIYRAYDPQLERPVALKLLRAAGDDEAASRFRERLLREAQALAQLAHPNVVAVHDVGTFGEGVFIAMEFIEGQTQRSISIRETALGPDNPELVKPLLAMGRLELSRHAAASAKPPLERALAIRGATPGDEADVRFVLAQVLWSGGDRERALGLARQAQELYAKSAAYKRDAIGELALWLDQHR
jgi:hypothetical protein